MTYGQVAKFGGGINVSVGTIERPVTGVVLYGPNGTAGSFEFVSQEIATLWMEKFNTHNRTLKKAKSAIYAEDMRLGNWREDTWEPIRFGVDGVLQDGQNRLQAIIDSGVGQTLLVVRNCPSGVQDVIDSGVPRSVADLLRLHGTEYAALAAAITRKVIVWESGQRNRLDVQRVSPSMVRDRYDEGIVDAVRVALERTGIPCASSLVGFTWFVTSRISHLEAETYFAALATGADLGARHPALIARNSLIKMRTARHTQALADSLVNAIFRGWNAFREGRELTKLYPESRTGGIVEPV